MSAVKLWNDKKVPYKYYKSFINVVPFTWHCEKDTEIYVFTEDLCSWEFIEWSRSVWISFFKLDLSMICSKHQTDSVLKFNSLTTLTCTIIFQYESFSILIITESCHNRIARLSLVIFWFLKFWFPPIYIACKHHKHKYCKHMYAYTVNIIFRIWL